MTQTYTPTEADFLDVYEKGWRPPVVAQTFGIPLKEAFEGLRLAKQKLIDAKRSRLRVPTWGHDGVLAAYGAGGMEAISRRKCHVQSTNRFPYEQSPV